jgi:hypothetical protein
MALGYCVTMLTFGATCMAPGSPGHDSALRFAEGNAHFVAVDILRAYNGGFEGELFDSD